MMTGADSCCLGVVFPSERSVEVTVSSLRPEGVAR
ncbi:hypothetical protein OI25_608 [Paraburkholderia fungorum]|uniref:Uncharacterized protein n=1 Tax=Paraburkholderia fungorum TaxID=134537 RepID=A0AAU8TJ79_9BURK|nr:hypothetical protein OI25_608 [Paraburkholderia fungorum]